MSRFTFFLEKQNERDRKLPLSVEYAVVANHHQTEIPVRTRVCTKINSDCDQFQI